MGYVLLLIFMGAMLYMLSRRGSTSPREDFEKLRNRFPTPEKADKPRARVRDRLPRRTAGQPRMQPKVARFTLLTCGAAGAFLAFVGIVGQSLVPPLLLLPFLAFAITLVAREKEREERAMSQELDSVFASAGQGSGEWYVPEEWS